VAECSDAAGVVGADVPDVLSHIIPAPNRADMMAVMMSLAVPEVSLELTLVGCGEMPVALAGGVSCSPRAACNCSSRRAMACTCLSFSGLAGFRGVWVERADLASRGPNNAPAASIIPIDGEGLLMATVQVL